MEGLVEWDVVAKTTAFVAAETSLLAIDEQLVPSFNNILVIATDTKNRLDLEADTLVFSWLLSISYCRGSCLCLLQLSGWRWDDTAQHVIRWEHGTIKQYIHAQVACI